VDVFDEFADLEGPRKVTEGYGIGSKAGLDGRSGMSLQQDGWDGK
jgi:hypothetical protein